MNKSILLLAPLLEQPKRCAVEIEIEAKAHRKRFCKPFKCKNLASQHRLTAIQMGVDAAE